MVTFWALLNMAMHMTGSCRVVTESTHSTPATQTVVVYGGNCLQALVYVLTWPVHNLAWEIG